MNKRSIDWESVGMFVCILLVVVGVFGSVGYVVVAETINKNARAKQCIAAGKEWVEGNCLSAHRSLDKD